MNRYVIQTNKGYICENNAKGTYDRKDNSYYQTMAGAFFNSMLSDCEEVDRLGFTDSEEQATKYCSCVGNRVQEIIDRINAGFENIDFIKVITIGERK